MGRLQGRGGLRSAHPDAGFPDEDEYGHEISHSEEFANLFAEIDELNSAACRFTGDVEAHERAEAHAVHAGKV